MDNFGRLSFAKTFYFVRIAGLKVHSIEDALTDKSITTNLARFDRVNFLPFLHHLFHISFFFLPFLKAK